MGWMSFLPRNVQFRSTELMEHKAVTLTSGLASSYLHQPLDSWEKGRCFLYAGSNGSTRCFFVFCKWKCFVVDRLSVVFWCVFLRTDILEPRKPRPETTASAAINMVHGALGLRRPSSKEHTKEHKSSSKEHTKQHKSLSKEHLKEHKSSSTEHTKEHKSSPKEHAKEHQKRSNKTDGNY